MPPAANGGSEGEIESAAGHLDDPPPCRWSRFLTLVEGDLQGTWMTPHLAAHTDS